MERVAETVEERSRRRLLVFFVRTASTVVLAAVALTALPIAAAVDPIGDQPIAPATQPETEQLSEDRDTISSLQPEPGEDPEPDEATKGIPKLVFPLSSPGSYTASFGAPRSGGRTHKGIDIFADKLTPVVAAADGTVTLVRDTIGGDCCVLRLRHEDGSETLYLHLNNDTPGTDDGLGYGIAEGITLGASVQAGQVIGFVGDSGNAEDTPPHLHFEYHEPSGAAIDPYVSLRVSQGADPADFAAMQEIPTELAFTGVSTLFLVTIGFAMVIIGILATSFAHAEGLWNTETRHHTAVDPPRQTGSLVTRSDVRTRDQRRSTA